MRRIVTISLLGLAAGLGACSTPDLVHPTDDPLYAGVRFINAVPDTAGAFGLDMRFVDLIESNAQYRVTFRNTPSANKAPTTDVSTAIQYKGARQGNRHFRIFLDDTLQAAASTVLKDTSVDLLTQHNYTAMLWGNARSAAGAADAMHLSFWEENEPLPQAGKVKLRVINTMGRSIDVWAFPTGGTVPVTATWAAVAPYSASTYVEVDSGSYTYRVDTAGVAVFSDRTAMLGATPTCDNQACQPGQNADIEAAPGTRVEGSAISGIVFPQSVAGSKAAPFTSAAITFVWDIRPKRSCDPYC